MDFCEWRYMIVDVREKLKLVTRICMEECEKMEEKLQVLENKIGYWEYKQEEAEKEKWMQELFGLQQHEIPEEENDDEKCDVFTLDPVVDDEVEVDGLELFNEHLSNMGQP